MGAASTDAEHAAGLFCGFLLDCVDLGGEGPGPLCGGESLSGCYGVSSPQPWAAGDEPELGTMGWRGYGLSSTAEVVKPDWGAGIAGVTSGRGLGLSAQCGCCSGHCGACALASLQRSL